MNGLSRLGILGGSIMIAACASEPVDNSPAQLTSVVTAKFAVNGLFVPDSHGQQVVYTREDKRRLDTELEHDNFLMGWADSNKSDIFRLDSKLLWRLNHDQKEYLECPLNGCHSFEMDFLSQIDEQEGDEEEDAYESYEERGCQVTLANHDFKVVPTGNQRVIAGLDAREYTVNWKTEFEDQAGKRDVNVLRFVFWTTNPTAEMKTAWATHQKATDNYLDAVGDNHLLVRLLGREGYKALGAFSGDLEQTNEAAFNNFTRELAKVKGYPLSTKFEWFQHAEACAVPKKKGAGLSDIDWSNGIENAAMDFVGGLLDQQQDAIVADWEKDARVRYIYEVTSVSQKMVRDSQFSVPGDYELMDRQ